MKKIFFLTVLSLAAAFSASALENEFTVSLWVKIADWPDPDAGKGKDGYGFFSSNWRVRMQLGADKTLSVQTTTKSDKGEDVHYALRSGIGKTVCPGEWNHFALTYSVAAQKTCLYVNGVLTAARDKDVYGKCALFPADADLDKVVTGSLAGGYMPLKGQARGLKVVRKALSAEEIETGETAELAAVLKEQNLPAKDVTFAALTSARRESRLSAADARFAKGKSIYWGTVDPMGVETYLPDSDLPEPTVGQPIQVVAAKGEYEAASVVIRPLKDYPDFVPVVSGFETKASFMGFGKLKLPASIVDTRIVKVLVQSGGGAKNRHIRVKLPVVLLHDDAMIRADFETMENYIRLDKPEGTVYECVSKQGDSYRFEEYMSAKDWPIHDAKEIRPLDLRKRFGQQYWFTFHVPADAKPGLYHGKVDFTSRGAVVASVPVKLRVLPFRLPEPRTSYDLSRKIYPGVYYRHNGHNLTDPNAPGSITSCGRNEAQFRAELRSLREHGILYPYVVMAIKFPGWNWKHWKDPAKGGEERVVTDKDRAYFNRLIAIMKEEGFPMDKLFFHSGGNWGFRLNYGQCEEYPGQHKEILKRSMEETFRMVKEAVGYDTDVQFYGVDEAWGEELKREIPCWKDIRAMGGRIFTTAVRRHTADVAPYIDTLIASTPPGRQYAKMMHDNGGLIWNYANPQAGRKSQPNPYRINYGFGVYSENYDGFATYAWNVSAANPWNDFDNRVEPDLAFVIGTADGVVDTPSYEGYREGVDDIRYATLLRMLCQKHPGPRADAATKMLDAINVYERGFDSGWMRLQIIEAILDLLEM